MNRFRLFPDPINQILDATLAHESAGSGIRPDPISTVGSPVRALANEPALTGFGLPRERFKCRSQAHPHRRARHARRPRRCRLERRHPKL